MSSDTDSTRPKLKYCVTVSAPSPSTDCKRVVDRAEDPGRRQASPRAAARATTVMTAAAMREQEGQPQNRPRVDPRDGQPKSRVCRAT